MENKRRTGRKANRWKQFFVAGFAGVFCMGLFSGCGDKEEALPLPTVYPAGEEEIAALTAPEGTAVTLETTRQYIYDGLENTNELVKAYAADLLAERIEIEIGEEEGEASGETSSQPEESQEKSSETEEDSSEVSENAEDGSETESSESEAPEKKETKTVVLRYFFVNDNFEEVELPDFNAETGSAHLARATGKENELISIRAEWTPTRCAVTVGMAHGVIKELPPKENNGSAFGSPYVSPMTELEAIDYVASLTPSQLGLEGASMEEYDVYSMTGSVMVNDEPCMQIRVFSKDNPAGTNAVEAFYLIDSMGTLYRIEESTGEISKVLERE